MHLKHLNLAVTDAQAAREFLEKYFGLKTIGTRASTLVALSDDDGFVLTLMNAAEANYPKTFHIGFPQASEERVNAIYQRLANDGFDVNPPQRSHGWTFYVNAPGGFLVEVVKG